MKKKSTAKKVLLTILGVLLALVIVLVGTVYVIWHDEITTLLSFQQVTQRDESHKDGSVYVLNVSAVSSRFIRSASCRRKSLKASCECSMRGGTFWTFCALF